MTDQAWLVEIRLKDQVADIPSLSLADVCAPSAVVIED